IPDDADQDTEVGCNDEPIDSLHGVSEILKFCQWVVVGVPTRSVGRILRRMGRTRRMMGAAGRGGDWASASWQAQPPPLVTGDELKSSTVAGFSVTSETPNLGRSKERTRASALTSTSFGA